MLNSNFWLRQQAMAKQADDDPYSAALQVMKAKQLKSEALEDVRNLAMATLGIGAGVRGLGGLYNAVKQEHKPAKSRAGPAMLPLPYPVEPDALAAIKGAGFWAGDSATTKGGIPWYGPAMLAGGLGGLAAGWKGVDAVLKAKQQRDKNKELEKARSEFHDALLSQYEHPIGAKQANSSLAAGLDALYEAFTKAAIDWSNLGGGAASGYGMYAGLTGLLTGALVYDKASKRSRRAVIEKALQRRDRRRFAQQPTDIYAVPEPVTQIPKPSLSHDLNVLKMPEE